MTSEPSAASVASSHTRVARTGLCARDGQTWPCTATSEVPVGRGVLHSAWSGASGLAFEVDDSQNVVLVRRDLRGGVASSYVVTNAAAHHAALDQAIRFRDALEAEQGEPDTTSQLTGETS